MRRTITFIIKLFILILLGVLVYLNYDTIKLKTEYFFDKAINYASESGIIDIEGIGTFINDADLRKLTDTGVTGDNLSFSSVYYPYYEMLNSKEKRIYKQVYANAEKLNESFVPVDKIDVNELSDIIYAINYDHPELFYLDTTYGYKYTDNNVCAQIILNYNELADNITVSKSNFNNEVDKIVNNANKYRSNYEKEKYVHDYLVKNVDYDLNSKLNQSAYSALVYKESVCSGYAKSFQYIMTKLSIPVYYVVGSSTEGSHAWNLISLSDGFYNIDVTFDDTTMSHKYFNLESEEFDKNHKRMDASLKLPDALGSKFLGYRKVKGYSNNYNSSLD